MKKNNNNNARRRTSLFLSTLKPFSLLPVLDFSPHLPIYLGTFPDFFLEKSFALSLEKSDLVGSWNIKPVCNQ